MTYHISHGKVPKEVLVAGKSGQRGLDQVLSAGEVANLVCLHRAALLENVQIFLHEHRLGIAEVEAVVINSLCFSAHLLH